MASNIFHLSPIPGEMIPNLTAHIFFSNGWVETTNSLRIYGGLFVFC